MSALSPHPDPAAVAENPAAVQASALEKWIDDRLILQQIHLNVMPGQFTALLGANGAGKSTLLKILATLMSPSAGQLVLFGKPVGRDAHAVRSRLGLIGHQSMLYRDLTAFENLRFFGKLYGIADPSARAQTLLKAVCLWERADDPVKSFSRGMAQRVAIARALVHDPDLLLADEPFDGLDAPSSHSLEQLLTQLHQAGKTIILANHNIEQSLRLTQRAIVLRQGRVVIDDASEHLQAAAVLKEMA
ncbi:MAG: ABC transporter ATP-binding protein [Bacillota bacterium]